MKNERFFSKTAPFFAFLLITLLFASPLRAIEVQRVISPSGVEAWLVEDKSNPILSMAFGFRGGSAEDPEGKEGLSDMVAALLDEGAGPYDSQTFQELLADNSISLSYSGGQDNFTGNLTTLKRNLDLAAELLRLSLNAPRFDVEPVARIRRQMLVSLQRAAEDPGTIAWRSLYTSLFPDHPYGRPGKGTQATLEALTKADLQSYVANRLTRDRLVIGVSGDITTEDLAELLEEAFGGLPASGTRTELPYKEVSAQGDLMIVEREQPQAEVVMAQPGIARDHPDFFAAYIANFVLGGGSFSSRLYEEVREKRGLAYSVYSYLAPMEYAALVVAGVGTQNARVAETIEIMKAEWAKVAQRTITAEELDAAKTFLTGSYPLRLSSTGKIARLLRGLQLDNLDIDYIDKRNGYIEAVTLEQANEVAARLYDPEALTIVVVGQPQGLEATREAPNLLQ